MSKAPFPGFNPNHKKITMLGGFDRTCLVVEILSLQTMDNSELAVIQEVLELAISKVKRRLATVESVKIVTPDRFDPLLNAGLRL